MKTFAIRVLSAIGLAPAGRVRVVNRRAEEALRKAQHLEERMAKLRTDVERWKSRQQEASSALAAARKAASRAEADGSTARGDVTRLKGELEQSRTRVESLEVEVRELRERLRESRRVTTLAREHLMATEVKLDLIEAAIQVLDTRTREGTVAR